MPRALEPGGSFDVWLESDKDKPLDERPTFQFRHMHARDWRKTVETADAHLDGGDLKQLDDTFEAIRISLIGWRNMGIDYDAGELDAVLDPQEALEVLRSVLRGGRLSADEKKD